MSVVGKAGRFKSLTLGFDRTNPRFPRKPSATMLTYTPTGTTEAIGIDHDELDQSPPPPAGPARATTAQSSRTMVHLEGGAALLTCTVSAGAPNVEAVTRAHASRRCFSPGSYCVFRGY